jgi:hypothetical protein
MNFKSSIDRAILLMNTPADYKGYISIKIRPFHGGCCCFHCWPQTWDTINRYIYPCGPIKDEGDVLIVKNDEKFVLECHESEPEIIIYLGLVTASISIVKSIIDLIVTLLKARQDDHYKPTTKLKITKSYQIGSQVREVEIMELNLPLSSDVIKQLNKNIRGALKIKRIKK